MYTINLSDERYDFLKGPEQIEALACSIVNYLRVEEKEDFSGEIKIQIDTAACDNKNITSESLLNAIKEKIIPFINLKTQRISVTPLYLSPETFSFYKSVFIRPITVESKFLIEKKEDSFKYEFRNVTQLVTKPVTQESLSDIALDVAEDFLERREQNKEIELVIPFSSLNIKLALEIANLINHKIKNENLKFIPNVNTSTITFVTVDL